MEHTLVLRLAEDDDPVVAQLWERCLAAAQAFGGELTGWETGNALRRVVELKERLAELHGPEHGPPVADEAPAEAPRRVAGEVVAPRQASDLPTLSGLLETVELLVQELAGQGIVVSPTLRQRLARLQLEAATPAGPAPAPPPPPHCHPG